MLSSYRKFFLCLLLALNGFHCSLARGDDGALLKEVIVALREHLKSDALGPVISRRYRNDDRIDACWKNPAGSKLHAWQKLLYCHYPLEFRMCLTPWLLAYKQDPNRVAKLVDAYRTCEAKLNSRLQEGGRIQGDRYQFDLVHPAAEAIFVSVYINGEIPDADADAFIAEIGLDLNRRDRKSFGSDVRRFGGELFADTFFRYPRYYAGTVANITSALPVLCWNLLVKKDR